MALCRWALAGLFLSAGAGADPAAAATSIWYRSSDRCPDGAAFLERLEQLGRSARLADAGDTIDFVVTLGAKDGGSFGRLERQTERGTVAIREVEAPACVEVADALALSLDLALDPGSGTDAPPPPTSVLSDAPASTEAAAPQQAQGAPGPKPEPRTPPSSALVTDAPTARSVGHDEAPREAEAAAFARVGAQGMLVTGVGDTPLMGAAIFGELLLGVVTPRIGVWGATGSSDVDGSRLRLRLFAARLEGCVGPFGAAHLYFHPCVGADLGVVDARYAGANGGRDTAPWVSPLLLGRGVWFVLERVSVAAEIGLQIPLINYELGESGAEPLATTDPVGAHTAVGLGITL